MGNNWLQHPKLDNEKIFMARLMSVMSIILFIAGIGLDYISVKDSLHEILLIRIIACLTLISVYLATFYQKFFITNYLYFVSTVYTVSAYSIIAMLYYIDVNDVAYSTYFAGLMLVIITVFLGTYIDTYTSIAISIAIVASFLVMTLLLKETRNIHIILNNLFFLSSTIVTGIITNSMRNKFLSEKIFLQERLKKALRNEKALVQKKSTQANFDDLTLLSNRRHSKELLKEMVNDAQKLDMACAILYMDLNKFKFINDNYGHNVGDQVLKIAATRLDGLMRKNDIISRQGGDEFLIAFLIEKDEMDHVEKIKTAVSEVISKPIRLENLKVSVGASIGSAIYPANGTSISALIDIADHKMYSEKKRKALEQNQPISGSYTNEKHDPSTKKDTEKNHLTLINSK